MNNIKGKDNINSEEQAMPARKAYKRNPTLIALPISWRCSVEHNNIPECFYFGKKLKLGHDIHEK